MNNIGNSSIGKVPRTHASYSKAAVIAWLEAKFPAQPWGELLKDAPSVIWRRNWNELRDKVGLPYAKTTMSRLDAQGLGPERLS